MAQNKTARNDGNVATFLDSIELTQRRLDAFKICTLIQQWTGHPPEMWGSSIVGFGRYTYKYASGRTGEWMLTGFSPRKQSLTLYIMSGFNKYDDLLSQLGKFTTGKSCLYVKSLDKIDLNVLEKLVTKSVQYVQETMDYKS